MEKTQSFEDIENGEALSCCRNFDIVKIVKVTAFHSKKYRHVQCEHCKGSGRRGAFCDGAYLITKCFHCCGCGLLKKEICTHRSCEGGHCGDKEFADSTCFTCDYCGEIVHL